MTNPIPAKVRAILYTAGIMVGALATVTPTTLTALGISGSWSSVVIALVGVITTIIGLLARGNLTVEDVQAVTTGVKTVAADVKAAQTTTSAEVTNTATSAAALTQTAAATPTADGTLAALQAAQAAATTPTVAASPAAAATPVTPSTVA